MRTDQDLRAALDTLAGPAPDARELYDRLLAAPASLPERAGTRPRVLGPVVAALAVAAVAVAAVVLAGGLGGRGTDDAAGPATTPPLTWRFAVAPVRGYTITRTYLSRPDVPATDTEQTASITATGRGRTTGSIDLSTVPGRVVTSSDVVAVKGTRYYFRAGVHVTRQGGLTPAQYADPWKAVDQDSHGPQLSWRNPDGSQVIVSGSFGFRPTTYTYDNATARAQLLTIAAAVRVGRHDPVRAPFRLTAVPRRLIPVSQSSTPIERAHLRGTLGGPRPLSACLGYATEQDPSPENPTESVLTVCRVEVLSTRAAALEDVSMTREFVARTVVRPLRDGTLLVAGTGIGQTGLVSAAQLRAAVRSADVLPSLGKPTGWLPVG